MTLLTVESMNGKNMPIRNIPARGPIDAEERLIVNCNTAPNFSTICTKPINNT